MRAYEVCGYNALSKRRGVPLYDMKKEPGVQVQTHGISLSVCKRALEADAIINVPVLKAHCQTALTCAPIPIIRASNACRKGLCRIKKKGGIINLASISP